MASEDLPLVRDGLPKELEARICELLLRGVVEIVGGALVRDPQSFDRVQVRAIRRQLDQMDAALRPGEERPDIRPFVVSSIVLDHMDEAFVGIARLDLGKKLRGTDPVYGGLFDKGRVEGLKVEHTMDIYAPAPCGGYHGRV